MSGRTCGAIDEWIAQPARRDARYLACFWRRARCRSRFDQSSRRRGGGAPWPQRRRQIDADQDSLRRLPARFRGDLHSRRRSRHRQSARRQGLWHRNDLSKSRARGQCRYRRQSFSWPRIAHALGHARRHRDGGGSPQGHGPAQPALSALQGSGQSPVRRAAPISRDRARDFVQRADPDHGRADGSARSAGNRASGGADQKTQGRWAWHFPDQPRHSRRVRSRRPDLRDEKRPRGRDRARRRCQQGLRARHDHPRQMPARCCDAIEETKSEQAAPTARPTRRRKAGAARRSWPAD